LTRKGCLWFAGGLLLAAVAGVLAFMAVLQATSKPKAAEETRVPVLVATRDIPVSAVLAAGDVTVRQVPPEVVPEGAATDPKDAVGMVTTAAVARDEIILRSRLLKPDYVGPQVAFVMDPKKVVVAFPTIDLLSSIDILRPGDRVDMMFSFPLSKMNPDVQEMVNTLTILSDVQVAAVVRAAGGQANQPGQASAGAPKALLLALDPQDALTLKFLRDNGASADFALRSPVAPSGPFTTVPVDGDYIMQRFKLRGRVAR
jgi:pilus assembly protein CpaB